MKIIETVCTLPCVLLLSVFGIYFSVKSGFVQIFGLKRLFSESKNKESLSAFATALGGTVGIGSITGIGFAISQGGAGSIFWMWVSSFFAMGIKYAETFLAVKYKEKNTGGAMYALRKSGFSKLGIIFAILTVLTSLGGGNSAQSGAMAEAFADIGVSPLVLSVVSAVVLYAVLFKGRKGIVKVNSIIVPLSTILYVLGMVFILFKTGDRLGEAACLIVKDAFGIRQAGAGISAYIFSTSLKVGTLRGVFSHEAGMGSSPIAHSGTECSLPEKQGIFAIAEIYVDTFIVGTLTALCLLCNDTYSVSKLFLKFFGKGGGVVFALFMAVFAFAAVLSWCYYSESCLCFLFGDSKRSFGVYKILAIFVFVLGCNVSLGFSFVFSDIMNCLMTYPNLFLIFIKRKEIIHARRPQKRILGDDVGKSFANFGKQYFGVKR